MTVVSLLIGIWILWMSYLFWVVFFRLWKTRHKYWM